MLFINMIIHTYNTDNLYTKHSNYKKCNNPELVIVSYNLPTLAG